ncbi:MAG: glycosyltransferase [Melioribacteraceae bacterium]|nr:glycosyltransferase [Melioribacteraceae bacterium]
MAPYISIIICTYNRVKYIGECLSSLVHQTLSKDLYEIVIVNNNSTDNTAEICESFIENYKEHNVTYVIERKQGLSFARNRGIKEAKGNIVIFIDDDGEAKNDYLEKVYFYFVTDEELVSAGGKVLPKYEAGIEPKWMSKYLWGLVTKIDYGNKIKQFPQGRYPVGCNMIFLKSVFDEIGMFDTELGRKGRVGLASEEKEIFLKLSALGKKILYIPEAVVKHNIDKERTTKEYVIKLSLGIGKSERVRTMKKGIFSLISKFIEFKIKFLGSLILALRELFKGEKEKGYYLVLFRFYVLKGFFTKI